MIRATGLPVTLVLAAFVFAPRLAAAQGEPSPDARPSADVLFTAARQLMEEGRYAEACAKLEESLRMEAAGGTVLNLALCYTKVGRVASAWVAYRDALDLARRSNRPDREKVAQDAMSELEPELPHLVLRVPEGSRVTGLKILRGGVELTEASWGETLPVDPGEMAIDARAPGYVPWTTTVHVALRQTVEVVVPPLSPEPPAVVPEPVLPPAAPAQPLPMPGDTVGWWSTRRAAAVSLIGAGLVAVGVGAYYGLQSLAKRSDSDAQCPSLDGRLRCTQGGADAMSAALNDAWVSDFAIGGGAAAAVGGALLLVTSRTPVRAAVSRLPGGGAVTLAASF